MKEKEKGETGTVHSKSASGSNWTATRSVGNMDGDA